MGLQTSCPMHLAAGQLHQRSYRRVHAVNRLAETGRGWCSSPWRLLRKMRGVTRAKVKGEVEKLCADLKGGSCSMAEHLPGFSLHHDCGLILNGAGSSKHQTTCLVLLRRRTCVGVSAACKLPPLGWFLPSAADPRVPRAIKQAEQLLRPLCHRLWYLHPSPSLATGGNLSYIVYTDTAVLFVSTAHVL